MKRYNDIKLNVGCGDKKENGWVGMDRRKLKCVDIVHDIEDTPWPLKDNSCRVVGMFNILGHLDPARVFEVMNEVWRVTKPEGQVFISVPYFSSYLAFEDPSLRRGYTESSFLYFDSTSDVYDPSVSKPFKIVHHNYDVLRQVEVVMEPMKKSGRSVKIRGKK